ncbi:hypothetical protein [Asticcacaulis taihuensis]|uniref:hypothetical protein n=1 Tax=Asticcacaulis taihuensis TaxID=260084 RepID=UPI0026EF6684|nr:hypothetical protein [Asticcacaulis taihuensis]
MTDTAGEKRKKPKSIAAIDAMLATAPDDDVAFASVRELGKQDPIKGAPLRCVNDAGEEFYMEPGSWTDERVQADYLHHMGRELIDPESELPWFVPVQALGVDSSGLTYYFFNTLGHVVQLKGESGKGVFALLFAGRNRLLFWLFPRWTDKGTRVAGWEADDLKEALTMWAGWCETFDDEENVRGRGMWADDFGNPVFHAGNAVMVNGKWCKPGRYGRFIYPARPATGRPKRHRDMTDVGARVLKVFQTWNWERPRLDPILKLGWVMTAKMGGALYRRPFIWVTGPRGCGKSLLQTFSRSLMHGSLIASSDTTAAGIYHRLGRDSIPVALDEQEAQEDTRTTDRIMRVIRASYSGDSLDRGGENGKAKTYALRSSFMASSISKPPMESSDDSRMALLALRERADAGEGKPFTEPEAYRMGQALTQRAIDWFPRWGELLAMVEAAMRTRKGHEARSLDTFAPFLAGYHAALYDGMPTDEQLEEYADLADPRGLGEIKTQMTDWEKCMVHLLGAMPEQLKHFKKKTIGQVVALYVKQEGCSDTDMDELLAGFRLCLSFKKGDPATFENARLFVPNIDPALVDLFANTSWAGKKGSAGAWNGVLKQAPRDLWEEAGSTKGGLGTVRGIAFNIKKLWAYLNRDTDALEAQAIAKPEPAAAQGTIDFDAEYDAYEAEKGAGHD